MRRFTTLLITSLILGCAIVACSKDEVYSLAVPSKSILVSMPGETGTTDFDSHNITSITVTSTPEGWNVDNIDMYSGTISVTAPSSFDDKEVTEGTLSLKGYTPTGETKSIDIYVAILPNADVDYTAAPANCYIANAANTRYRFNPYVGGSKTQLDTDHIALIWESKIGVIKYLDLRNGYASFYVGEETDDDDQPTGKITPGNALIGGYNADGELIWSWHIWVTNSTPTTDTFMLNGREVMNINLGADCNSEGSKVSSEIFRSYGLYYQWGRRTPFVGPMEWNFSGNTDARMYNAKESVLYLAYDDSTDETGNIAWADNNPLSFVKGNPENGNDWLYASHDDTLWSATTKSEQDPCPAGWRVADASVFENLTIAAMDDDMSWEEAQPMYGWNLEDIATGESHFFTAAGRRNYLDGRLDIINDDDFRPIPWSGYYWTATTDGAEAKALYFDLNTETRTWNAINTSRSMHRANALPVRCVRE